MKTIAKLTLAAALVGAGGMTVAPAFAKDKKDDKAAAATPGLKLSPDVLKAAQPAQVALQSKDVATAEPLVAQAEAAAQTDADKYVANTLRYQLESMKIDAARTANPNAPANNTPLVAPLQALVANPNTPQTNRAGYYYVLGQLSFIGHQYPAAIQYFTQAKQQGYADKDIDLALVKAKFESGDVNGGAADLDTAVKTMTAAGQKAPEEYYRYAIARANAAKNKAVTLDWLQRYAAAYPTANNWRQILVTFGLAQQSVDQLDNAQKLDLFRLMHAAKALGDQNDYEEYAQKAADRGLPAEAVWVLQEGQSTGKIPAGNSYATSLMTQAKSSAAREGSLTGTEAKAKASADGKLAAQTGDAYLSQKQYAKAADLYRTAIQKGGVNADEVNTHLGIALSYAGDTAGATAAFQQVKGAPRGDLASFWTLWLANRGQAAG